MVMSENYRICNKCVMDNSDPNIQFSPTGICNHCMEYEKIKTVRLFPPESRENRLSELISDIKNSGRNKDYDCVMGLSGGVDSSYAAYIARKNGLRPLAVHLDNGWNSELAVKNIENIITNLKIDLYTYVIDWEEFKDLQLSYFKASVIDIEVLTDHAISAILYKTAARHGIKHILSGANVVSEAILPQSWISDKNDLLNIKHIHRRFGSRKIKTFPKLGLTRYLYYRYYKNINVVPILNYVDYNKVEALHRIVKELSWRDYGGKHHESTFTKFYQAYILPEKFKVDKRRAHLSTLICSGQLTREEALTELNQPLYNDEELQNDILYVTKKWGMTPREFDQIMALPIRQYTEYPTSRNRTAYKVGRSAFRKLRDIGMLKHP